MDIVLSFGTEILLLAVLFFVVIIVFAFIGYGIVHLMDFVRDKWHTRRD